MGGKQQVWEKVEEEMDELKTAIANLESVASSQEKAAHQKEVEAEFGDLIFSLINYARFLQVDAENALELTNKNSSTGLLKWSRLQSKVAKTFIQ